MGPPGRFYFGSNNTTKTGSDLPRVSIRGGRRVNSHLAAGHSLSKTLASASIAGGVPERNHGPLCGEVTRLHAVWPLCLVCTVRNGADRAVPQGGGEVGPPSSHAWQTASARERWLFSRRWGY